MRKPLMAGNWKMNCDNHEARALACGVAGDMGDPGAAEVVMCVPATALTAVVNCVDGGPGRFHFVSGELSRAGSLITVATLNSMLLQ